MSIKELCENNRKEELKAIYKFITTCNFYELAYLIEEIRCYHNNLIVCNESTKTLDKVKSISINGECIQLNLK